MVWESVKTEVKEEDPMGQAEEDATLNWFICPGRTLPSPF